MTDIFLLKILCLNSDKYNNNTNSKFIQKMAKGKKAGTNHHTAKSSINLFSNKSNRQRLNLLSRSIISPERLAQMAMNSSFKNINKFMKTASEEQRFCIIKALITSKRSYKEYSKFFLNYSKYCTNNEDEEGRNLLILAAIYDYPEYAEFLLKTLKMDVNKTANNGKTAYEFANNEGCESTMKVIKLHMQKS